MAIRRKEETVGDILSDVTNVCMKIIQKGEKASPKEMQLLNVGNEILEVFKEIFRIVAEGGTSQGEAWYVYKNLDYLYATFKSLKA